MSSLRYAAIRGMFELLWASRATSIIRALSRARGVIFTLHRVLPDDPADFSPNAILQIKPEFLDYTIRRIRGLGYEIVDLAEAIRRLEADYMTRRFAVFTFDDAYRDNLRYAWKILNRGVCDGCALGVAGLHDWTIDGVHLCMTRLNLLRLNTMPSIAPYALTDVAELARRLPASPK